MESLQCSASDSNHDEPLQSAPLSVYDGVEKTGEPEITSYCAAEQESKMRLSSQVFRPNYRVCKTTCGFHPAWKLRKLECGPMPNVMAALPNIGGALCSTPQSLADADY